jgi:hypothetical protein
MFSFAEQVVKGPVCAWVFSATAAKERRLLEVVGVPRLRDAQLAGFGRE